MDLITHSLLGAVSAKTVNAPPRRFWIMILLGLAPDLDLLANFLGPWARPFQHHGLTHSLFGLFFQPLIYSFIFSRFDPGPYLKRAAHYSLPIFFHLLFDTLTAYGIPLLAPFGSREFSADLMVMIGIGPIIIMATGLVWLVKHGGGGVRHTKWIWIGLGVYLGATISVKALTIKVSGLSARTATMLPTYANPFSWRAVDLDHAHRQYQIYAVNLLSRESRMVQQIPMPGEDFPVLSSLQSSLAQGFLRDNRWPLVRYEKTPAGWRVEWGNLLFSGLGQVRGKVRVDVSDSGEVTSESMDVFFWNVT